MIFDQIVSTKSHRDAVIFFVLMGLHGIWNPYSLYEVTLPKIWLYFLLNLASMILGDRCQAAAHRPSVSARTKLQHLPLQSGTASNRPPKGGGGGGLMYLQSVRYKRVHYRTAGAILCSHFHASPPPALLSGFSVLIIAAHESGIGWKGDINICEKTDFHLWLPKVSIFNA